MRDPQDERAEVDAAEAEAHAAIARLVSLIRSDERLASGKATNAVVNLGRHIASSAFLALNQSELANHRLRLITLFECYGVHDPDTAIDVLGDLATSDPDYGVRNWALEARDKVLRHQRLEEVLD